MKCLFNVTMNNEIKMRPFHSEIGQTVKVWNNKFMQNSIFKCAVVPRNPTTQKIGQIFWTSFCLRILKRLLVNLPQNCSLGVNQHDSGFVIDCCIYLSQLFQNEVRVSKNALSVLEFSIFHITHICAKMHSVHIFLFQRELSA